MVTISTIMGAIMATNRLPKKTALSVLLAVAAGGIAAWWYVGGNREETDNAYIQGDITAIASKVSGYVVSVEAEDNASVKAGDILFRIDQVDFKAELAKAEAAALNGEASVERIRSLILLQHAQIVQAEADYKSVLAAQARASKEHIRQAALLKTGATTDQRHEEAFMTKEQADAAVLSARARVEVERHRLAVQEAEAHGAEADLASKRASLEIARSNLEHTIVRAPIDGVIGNRKVRLGRYVTTGTALLDIVPVDNVWVVANFKEIQLENIRKGQPVSISVDAYPHVPLTGTIDSIAPGSGAAFSLLPPDNATGNFIRVTQRVPVKIRLTDSTLSGRLVPGLSLRVSVDVHAEKPDKGYADIADARVSVNAEKEQLRREEFRR